MGTPFALLSILGRILVPCSAWAVEVRQAVSRTVPKRSSMRFTFHAWMSLTGDELGVVDSKHIDSFGPQVDADERAWCTAGVTEAGDLLGVWILEAVADVLVDQLEAACCQKAS